MCSWNSKGLQSPTYEKSILQHQEETIRYMCCGIIWIGKLGTSIFIWYWYSHVVRFVLCYIKGIMCFCKIQCFEQNACSEVECTLWSSKPSTVNVHNSSSPPATDSRSMTAFNTLVLLCFYALGSFPSLSSVLIPHVLQIEHCSMLSNQFIWSIWALVYICDIREYYRSQHFTQPES